MQDFQVVSVNSSHRNVAMKRTPLRSYFGSANIKFIIALNKNVYFLDPDQRRDRNH